MKTAEFSENYTIDRKTRVGVRANPKNAPAPETPATADGTIYCPTATYFFFDEQTQQIRQSTGLRRDGEFLCTFGLRVIPISKLRVSQDDALADGQEFFKSEIENLQNRIHNFETEKKDREKEK
jgi:hypothetical protein